MKISLYVHIPFCKRKCLYCDFLSGPYDDKVRSLYVDALLREIAVRFAGYLEYEVISIFFGGGTPSVLSDNDINRIMSQIRSCYNVGENCEVSMEVNPGTVSTVEQFRGYLDSGINRLSFGLQSAVDSELETLGRIHDRKTFLNGYKMAVQAGFTNINVDLMSGIPNQTTESLSSSLRFVSSLSPKPTHLSVYGLIVEEGTPFYDRYGENKPFEGELPSEEEEREMYKITGDFLTKAGYHRYEISNYALPGYECSHNKVYWKRGNYLGLGLGASSMVDNARWKNTSSMDEYIGNIPPLDVEYEVLDEKNRMEEYMFLGLRMMEGISISEFEKSFGRKFPKEYAEVVNKYVKLGLLRVQDNDIVMLTEWGIDVSNVIFADFCCELT